MQANLHNANGLVIKTALKVRMSRSVKGTLKAQSIFLFIFMHQSIPLGGFNSRLPQRSTSSYFGVFLKWPNTDLARAKSEAPINKFLI